MPELKEKAKAKRNKATTAKAKPAKKGARSTSKTKKQISEAEQLLNTLN